MSWLKNIYESIINEIGADDAYKRFYSSIPREDYDEILNGDPAPDKFMQFMLNCVRDGKSTKEDAIEAISAYKNADELVRQKVLNKFRSGEYEDALDVASDVKYLSGGGAVLSKKKFAKEGLIKLKENERWIATCTINYAANNHYFGDSHWCTASDREGRWDGYEMYRDYSGGNNVLIQFKWKGKVLPPPPKDGPEPLDDNYESVQYDDKLGYVGDSISYDDSAYQVQVGLYYGQVDIGQICDFSDNSSSIHTLKQIIGEDMYSVLEDKDMLDKLIEMKRKMYEKETEYQQSISDLIQRKKERRHREMQEKYDRLRAEADAFNDQKRAYVIQKWDEFINAAMYEDPEVLSTLIKRDVDSEFEEETDEGLEKTNFAYVMQIEIPYSRELIIMELVPILGVVKYIDMDDDTEDYFIRTTFTHERIDGKSIVVIARRDGSDVMKAVVPHEGSTVHMKELVGNGGNRHSRFFQIYTIIENNWDEGEGILFDAEKKKFINFKGVSFYEYVSLGEGKLLFFRQAGRYGNIDSKDYMIYDEESGNIRMSTENDPLIYTFSYGGGVVFYRKEDRFQTAYWPSSGIYNLKIPVSARSRGEDDMKTIKQLEVASDLPREGDVIGVVFGNDYNSSMTNAILYGKSEFLFGMIGKYVSVSNPRRVSMVYIDKSDSKWTNNIIIYDDGEYSKVSKEDSSKTVPCDKFGMSESERIAKKNYEDWVANGGHSPEAKAQMDKMWADRENDKNGENDGAAFRDWNDNDRMIDKEKAGGLKYSKDYPWNKSLQSFDDDDNWRGYMYPKDEVGFRDSVNRAIRDPNYGIDMLAKGEVPDYVRKNPWYRIGRDGKPIDQPWYDEDEIPANLSDRVVREHKINEGLNKMRSIWDRMGLND